jgi:hypothetical protein
MNWTKNRAPVGPPRPKSWYPHPSGNGWVEGSVAHGAFKRTIHKKAISMEFCTAKLRHMAVNSS